jgi:predicted transcriptional regulator
MDALYSQGKATVADVVESLDDAPGYSSVRKILQILEEKGHVRHVQDGQRYVYLPTQPRQSAARTAMKQVFQTFFAGNIEHAVLTLMSEADVDLSEADVARLSALIEAAKPGEKPIE